MKKVILTVGIPCSGKSTWALSEVSTNQDTITRINRDDLRLMMGSYNHSPANEKLVTKTSNYLLQQSLKAGRDVILDNTNLTPRSFDDTVKIVKELNIDCIVMEKPFYIELEEAIERDKLRDRSVGTDVIKKFWKKSGGKLHKFYNAKMEVINAFSVRVDELEQDKTLDKVAIFDLDGTMCNISHRNPYDASRCDNDLPNEYVVNLAKMFYNNGVKIMFFSGREDKFEDKTRMWLDVYFEKEYELYMRKTKDLRKDSEIKKELYESVIKDKYYVVAVVDDRLQVCRVWNQLHLPLFRVGDPEADF